LFSVVGASLINLIFLLATEEVPLENKKIDSNLVVTIPV